VPGLSGNGQLPARSIIHEDLTHLHLFRGDLFLPEPVLPRKTGAGSPVCWGTGGLPSLRGSTGPGAAMHLILYSHSFHRLR